MAAVRETKAVQARYWYIRAVFLHPDIRSNLASYLLIKHLGKLVGHGNSQEKARASSIVRHLAETNWYAALLCIAYP
jgi:hypothetical protein